MVVITVVFVDICAHSTIDRINAHGFYIFSNLIIIIANSPLVDILVLDVAKRELGLVAVLVNFDLILFLVVFFAKATERPPCDFIMLRLGNWRCLLMVSQMLLEVHKVVDS